MAGPRTLKVLHGSASRTLLPGCPWWSPGEVLAYPKAPPVSAAEKMTQRSQHMQLEAEPGQTPSDAPPCSSPNLQSPVRCIQGVCLPQASALGGTRSLVFSQPK